MMPLLSSKIYSLRVEIYRKKKTSFGRFGCAIAIFLTDQFLRLYFEVSNFILRIASIWSDYLLHVLAARGPYTKRKMSDQFSRLLEKAMFLFPSGPPFRSLNWTMEKTATVKNYNDFAMKLFGRKLFYN